MMGKVLKYCAITLIAIGSLLSCRKSDDSLLTSPKGVVSIAHLKTLATSLSTTIVDDLSVEGYIIANDLYGELYKSIYISDQSGGIELSVDSRHTATVFPIGARIVVHCTSLALGDYGGSLVLGAQPTAEYVVDRIAKEDFDRYFLIDRSSAQSIEPERISISDIEPRHIGNFVLLEDVNFGDQAGLAWCETDPESGEPITTERILYDNDGNSIILRIEGGCSYAKEKIPDRSGAIGAIVESFNGVYQIRIINRNIYF